MTNRLLLVMLSAAIAFALSGCKKEGCLGGEANCRVERPCKKVKFSCASTELSVAKMSGAAERPGGWDGLGTTGDYKLTNGQVDVVIAGIGNQNFIDPNGGSIIDLLPHGQNKDSVNGISQAVGILPRDGVSYTSAQIIDERPNLVAVQFNGTLDGIGSVPVYTRYELTPCDPGVRVRTEILNGSTDTQTWALIDAFYWSGREMMSFAPPAGFRYDSFGLTTINAAFKKYSWIAGAGHSSDDQISAIGMTSCTDEQLEGFQSEQISAAGLPRQISEPRASFIFERFFAVADSKDIAGPTDIILDVRKQLFGDEFVTIHGTVSRMGGGTFDAENEASVLVVEPDGSQWTQIVPKADGSFSARVPAGKTYSVEVHAFGRKQVERQFPSVSKDTDLGAFELPATGAVTFRVNGPLGGGLDAELFLIPQNADEASKVVGTLHGRSYVCAPWLGAPMGASPACNRVLVHNGNATAEVPLGKYDIFAFHGPFWSLGKQEVELTGDQTLVFTLVPMANLKPTGSLTADLHVHGARSFDSSIPDEDRVLSFAASGLDVVIGTDHEVIGDYSGAVQSLGLENTLSAVWGLETTGHIPFLMVPGYGFPLVIGHYNFWPLTYDPSKPRNGAPFDERVEPGTLFSRMNFAGEPVIELNHPWADPEFGRDLGFPRAIFMDLRKNLPATDDGTRQAFFNHTPKDSQFANDAHHAQEVMNGSQNDLLLQYRAFWHYTLNQGLMKTGTANSDSHSLTDNTVGVPQNVVFANTVPGTAFDIGVFNTALKAGRSFGTNGPVIDARIVDSTTHDFGFTPFTPAADASLQIQVRSAPWVRVDEVRVLVNGVVKKTITGLTNAADPLDITPQQPRYDGQIPLSELLAGVNGDAWVVVEAGQALTLAGDLGGGLDDDQDGMVDTTDNNGDGKVDKSDVAEGKKTGPLANPPNPARGANGYEFNSITGGFPFAFTNPFILDRNGDGAFTAPGVGGGQ